MHYSLKKYFIESLKVKIGRDFEQLLFQSPAQCRTPFSVLSLSFPTSIEGSRLIRIVRVVIKGSFDIGSYFL